MPSNIVKSRLFAPVYRIVRRFSLYYLGRRVLRSPERPLLFFAEKSRQYPALKYARRIVAGWGGRSVSLVSLPPGTDLTDLIFGP